METVWSDLAASASESVKYRPLSTTRQMPGPHPWLYVVCLPEGGHVQEDGGKCAQYVSRGRR